MAQIGVEPPDVFRIGGEDSSEITIGANKLIIARLHPLGTADVIPFVDHIAPRADVMNVQTRAGGEGSLLRLADQQCPMRPLEQLEQP